MSPDSAPGSNPDDLIDLSDIMDDSAGASGADAGDAGFDQELEDLFSDALPDDPGAPAPAAKANEQTAGDDAIELEDMDFSDLGVDDAPSSPAEAEDDIIDLTGFDAESADPAQDDADDDLIDLSEFAPVEETETTASGAEEAGQSEDDLLELTDLVEEPADAQTSEAAAVEDDFLELTDLEEIEGEKSATPESVGEMDADALDLTDLAAAPEAAAADDAIPEEPDLSDLLDEDAPEEHAAAASAAPVETPAMDETMELELPDIDLDLDAAADATLDASDLADLVDEPEAAEAPESTETAEADLDALAAELGADEQDAADLELDFEEEAEAETPAEPAEPEETAPAFAEQALDMAPEEAALAGAGAGAGAAAANGIDLAALDAIIEEAGGPPAEEPAPGASIASAEEFQEARDRIAALEAKTDALADKLDALPGTDALEALGEKLTAGFGEMLRREMDALKDGLSGHDDASAETIESAVSGAKDELLASMSESLDALRTEIEGKIPAPAEAPDAEALSLQVKERILPELQAAMPDAEAIARDLEAFSGRLDALASEIEKRATKVDLDAAATRIKMLLLEDIERSAAAAAAKVLREEIKALAEEEESE